MGNLLIQADPTAENVDRMIGPTIASVDRVPVKCIVAPLTAGGINAFAFAIQNPEDRDCLIVQLIIDITTTGGTATSVLDVDTVDGATATGDDIIDGLDLNALGTFDSIKNPGTNGDGKPVKWAKKGGTLDDLTGKILVAAATNLVGQVIVKYVPLG
jgi:hypothetical protein